MSKNKASGRSSEKDLSETGEEATMTRPIVMPDVWRKRLGRLDYQF
jgi:type 1 glutamine amidotransferase